MFETLRTALSSLLANKTRSLLTMLGVVIGVGAVIAMVAVGNGASVQMQDLVSGLGSNLLILSPGAPRSGGVRQSGGARLTLSDVRAVTEECWSVLRAAPLVNLSAQLIYENQNWPTRVTGTTPSYFDVDNHSIYLGRLLDEEDGGQTTGGLGGEDEHAVTLIGLAEWRAKPSATSLSLYCAPLPSTEPFSPGRPRDRSGSV